MSVLSHFPPAEIFIETGFGGGDTLQRAVQESYQEIHSIEVDAGLLIAKAHLFANDPRVHLHQGSSREILASLCQPARSTVFWLDAHYSAGQYTSDHLRDLAMLDPQVGQCALLAELAIIRAVPWEVWPILLIDDAACISMSTYEGMYAQHDRSQYPMWSDLVLALPPKYLLTQHDDGSGWYYQAVPREGVHR